MCVCVFSHVRAHQTPLSMGFSRQEYWGGLPFPTPGDLSNPGIEPVSLAFPALVGEFSTTVTPGKPVHFMGFYKFIMTCSHHYSISKYPLCSTYSSLPPSSPSVTDLFTMSIVLPFLDHHVVGIIHAPVAPRPANPLPLFPPFPFSLHTDWERGGI